MSDDSKVGRITFGPTLPVQPWHGPIDAQGRPAPLGRASGFAVYTPDPEDEAWRASPEGLRAAARVLRQAAADMVLRAKKLEADAIAKEAGI